MKKTLWLATAVMVIIALAACARPTATPAPTPTAPGPTPALAATPTPAVVATPGPTPTATPRPAPTPTPLGRQEALVAAARKEGTVVFWGTSGELAHIFLAPFKERYPFLELKIWDAGSATLSERITGEAKVGRHSVDVLQVPIETMAKLMPFGALERYDWPNTANWPPDERFGRAGDGFYSNFASNFAGPAYNTKRVSPAEAPKSWEDLKDPKWKGRAAATLSGNEAPLTLAAMWGQEGKLDWDRSFAFWREVFKNTQPAKMTGHEGPLVLLAAGGFDIIAYLSGSRVVKAKLDDGMPVETVPVDRLAVRGNALALVKNAPHPNAARLLLDYMTSTEGVLMFADVGYRLAVDPEAAKQAKANRLLKERGTDLYPVPAAFFTDANVKKADDFWNEMMGLLK